MPDPDARNPEPSLMGPGACVRWIFRSLAPYRGAACLILLGLLAETAFSAAVPMSFRYLIDRALVGRDGRVLVVILVGLGVAAVLVSLAGLGRDYLYARTTAALLRDLRARLFTHLQELSVRDQAGARTGDVLSHFSGDLGAVESALTSAVPWAILPALDLLFSSVLLFVLDWRMALLSLLIWPVALLGPRVFAPLAARASYEKRQQEGDTLSLVQENLSAQPVVKAFGLEDWARAAFGTQNKTIFQSAARLNFLSSMVERSAGIGILLLQVLILGVGGYLAYEGQLSVGSLVSFQTLFLTLSYSLSYVTQYTPQLMQAAGAVQRLEALLAQPTQRRDAGEPPAAPDRWREIRFEEVSFGYTPERRNLDRVSFTLRAGERVAFVGASGSGKSTVLALLLGFYEADEGRIRVDGRPLEPSQLAAFRRQIAPVMQESFLFNVSVRENIRLGRLTATDAEVEEAARRAEIEAAVRDLPEGFETRVGERGGRLSGGQRQRIAIARALVRNPALLVLDEATSALDAAAEAAINDTLARVGAGRTVLMVTHRLASVVDVDCVYVMDQGRIVEQGRHAELLARDGAYAALWEKQHGFTLSANSDYAAVTPERLRDVPLLSALDAESLATLAPRFVTELCPADREVVREGDAGDRFYLIVRGRVEVLKEGVTGEERVAVLTDGDHFGELALLRDEPRSATVRTVQPCVFLSLVRESFLQVLDRAPELRDRLEEIARQRG